jgi:hypothetical protein
VSRLEGLFATAKFTTLKNVGELSAFILDDVYHAKFSSDVHIFFRELVPCDFQGCETRQGYICRLLGEHGEFLTAPFDEEHL